MDVRRNRTKYAGSLKMQFEENIWKWEKNEWTLETRSKRNWENYTNPSIRLVIKLITWNMLDCACIGTQFMIKTSILRNLVLFRTLLRKCYYSACTVCFQSLNSCQSVKSVTARLWNLSCPSPFVTNIWKIGLYLSIYQVQNNCWTLIQSFR